MILQMTYRIPGDLYYKLAKGNQIESYKQEIEERSLLKNAGDKINNFIKFRELRRDEFYDQDSGAHQYQIKLIALDYEEWLTFRNTLKLLVSHTDVDTCKKVGELIKTLEQPKQ